MRLKAKPEKIKSQRDTRGTEKWNWRRELWSASRTVLLPAMLIMAACSPPASNSPEMAIPGEQGSSVPLVPDISINEIMVGQVDHAAHEILSLALQQDPRLTIGAWQELEHYTIQLISSTSAITMGGAGVNDAMWVAQSGWRNYAVAMQSAATDALQSVRNQDLPALLAAGDAIRASCDGCHQQYKPEVPTEGFYRIH